MLVSYWNIWILLQFQGLVSCLCFMILFCILLMRHELKIGSQHLILGTKTITLPLESSIWKQCTLSCFKIKIKTTFQGQDQSPSSGKRVQKITYSDGPNMKTHSKHLGLTFTIGPKRVGNSSYSFALGQGLIPVPETPCFYFFSKHGITDKVHRLISNVIRHKDHTWWCIS